MVSHKGADAVFRALADPTRREILGLLRGHSQTVGELAVNFRCSRPAISKHLRQLRTAGLVTTRKDGTASICQLNPAPLQQVDEWLSDYEELWMARLLRLKHYLEAENEGMGRRSDESDDER